MIELYERFLGEPVRHYDFTWVRAISPGTGTAPHCDHVYMGRGTSELYTAWTPLGDVSYELGGLMVLEKSHLHQPLRENYCRKDVDAFCSNRRGDDWEQMGGGGNIRTGGWLSPHPAKLRNRLGGRWLTTEYRAGDLLTFSTFLVHASLDNRTDHIRLSSDSRYQRASEPADERWIGPNPIGHGPQAKRGMIC
jgi:ectoine hydroxylase-related dioxygenase (phytanoyl-CoA dioxygenase family)